jgi:nitroreductase
LDADLITAAIRHRRTVKPKFFSNRSVDESLIREMLENANWAPTHGMTQPWRFRVFVGPARQRLADFLAQTYKDLTPPDQFKPNKFEGMSKNAMLAQAVIAVGMHRQKAEKISELDEIMAVACAVQNMHLTAAANGLGGFWSTNVAAISDAMRDFVGLDAKDRALGLFYVGYPAGDWPACERGPIDEKVEWKRE